VDAAVRFFSRMSTFFAAPLSLLQTRDNTAPDGAARGAVV
jgi:hypothetical protein